MAAKRSGLRYQLDRGAQSFGPQRSVDAWGFGHPAINALSFVALGIFFAVLLTLTLHSVVKGVSAGAVIAVIAVFTTKANHRRRLANGTSADYGPPK